MCVTHLLGVYCDGVFLYLHVIANFVYNILCGKFIVSMFVPLFTHTFINILATNKTVCK